MAQKKQIALRKQQLIAQLAESRQAIDHGRSALKEKLNVKKQVGSLIKRKPKAAFASAAVAGLATTLLLRRPRKNKQKNKKARKSKLLGWAVVLLKPTAKKWIKKRAKTYLLAKLNPLARPRQPQFSPPQSEITHQHTQLR